MERFLRLSTESIPMPTIHLTTFIKAPIDRVFDLSRSINLHKKSLEQTGEEAIAGTTSGLINLGESVTWKAKHLGKQRTMKIRITAMTRPHSFTDEMAEGDFRAIRHQHHFKQVDNGTIMIDLFEFETPYGVAGKVLNQLYLTRYLRRLLEQRNSVIKEYAESNKWQHLLA
jgi:ligand-binding SRPBCC domain-containing protein